MFGKFGPFSAVSVQKSRREVCRASRHPGLAREEGPEVVALYSHELVVRRRGLEYLSFFFFERSRLLVRGGPDR